MSRERGRIASLAAALLAAGFALPAGAAHPLITEDTGTQGQGNFQFELMFDRTRDRSPGVKLRELLSTAVLSYGVLENADLQFGLPYIRQHIRDAAGRHAGGGPLDASVDLKWRFFEQDDFSLGFKPGVTLPSGDEDRGLGTGRVAWGGLLILSYEPGSWAFHTHAGWRRNRNVVGERTSLRHLSGALTWQATEGLKLVADVGADSNPDQTVRGALRYRILGLIYSPTPSLDIDAGLKRGYGGASDRTVQFGLTLRW